MSCESCDKLRAALGEACDEWAETVQAFAADHPWLAKSDTPDIVRLRALATATPAAHDSPQTGRQGVTGRRDGSFAERWGARLAEAVPMSDAWCVRFVRQLLDDIRCGDLRASGSPTPRCGCTHEAGDSPCEVHPGCDECGAQLADGCGHHPKAASEPPRPVPRADEAFVEKWSEHVAEYGNVREDGRAMVAGELAEDVVRALLTDLGAQPVAPPAPGEADQIAAWLSAMNAPNQDVAKLRDDLADAIRAGRRKP